MYQFVNLYSKDQTPPTMKNDFETSAVKVDTRFASFPDSKHDFEQKSKRGLKTATVVSPIFVRLVDCTHDTHEATLSGHQR